MKFWFWRLKWGLNHESNAIGVHGISDPRNPILTISMRTSKGLRGLTAMYRPPVPAHPDKTGKLRIVGGGRNPTLFNSYLHLSISATQEVLFRLFYQLSKFSGPNPSRIRYLVKGSKSVTKKIIGAFSFKIINSPSCRTKRTIFHFPSKFLVLRYYADVKVLKIYS